MEIPLVDSIEAKNDQAGDSEETQGSVKRKQIMVDTGPEGLGGWGRMHSLDGMLTASVLLGDD